MAGPDDEHDEVERYADYFAGGPVVNGLRAIGEWFAARWRQLFGAR